MEEVSPSPVRRRLRSKRFWLIAAPALLVAAILIGPSLHLASTVLEDKDTRESLPPGHVDDASRMNATRVAEVWAIPADAAMAQLAELLR